MLTKKVPSPDFPQTKSRRITAQLELAESKSNIRKTITRTLDGNIRLKLYTR
jgi:hypothetical protein